MLNFLSRIPSTRSIRVYPLELCASYLSRPPSLNRPELIQEHLLKFQRVIRAATSRFSLKSFQHTANLHCFPLHELQENMHLNQNSAFMFGSGRPVPKANVHLHECDAATITHQHCTAIVQAQQKVPQAPSVVLKIPVFTRPSIATIATKRNIIPEEVSSTIQKKKKQDPDNSRQAVASVRASESRGKATFTSNSENSVERLLLQADICWSAFASFMSVQEDATATLLPLQVAQLKQILKMNPKGSKVSGTKNELMERIVAMLKAA